MFSVDTMAIAGGLPQETTLRNAIVAAAQGIASQPFLAAPAAKPTRAIPPQWRVNQVQTPLI